ncbi:MAG: hypothetical protein RBS55_13020 [Bacteroidales bacterium]|jgi:tRNA(Ile)-lysidine synthase TilS/MesJ|nr:hypothetical protein [Bacteroidales bacterium]
MEYQRCTRGLWDTTIPGIRFDEEGVSNFAKMQFSLMEQYPRGEQGKTDWESIVREMKEKGRNRRYDCIVGMSGGTDSSYLLHVCKQEGLRVLAVNLDNGWNSDIAVKNIKVITSGLNYDLETYVIDYEEVMGVLRSYILAGLPWIDGPTDIAIKSILYKIAAREKIKYILNGSDFRSEGKQPTSWTYTDTRQLRHVVKKFSGQRLRSFPLQPLYTFLLYGMVYKIKVIRPLYFLPYKKNEAKKLLSGQYGWIDYGGHHHENIFTRFAISYWLPEKFNIDKRIITLSAQVLSGEINRAEALDIISKKPYSEEKIEGEISYVLKKLKLERQDYDRAFNGPNNYFTDYPSYYPLIRKYSRFGKILSKKIFRFKPGIYESIDQNI